MINQGIVLMLSFSFTLQTLLSNENFRFIVSMYDIELVRLLYMYSLYIFLYIKFTIHYVYFPFSALYLHLRFSHLGRQCLAKNFPEDCIETFTIALNLPRTFAGEKFLY